MKSSIRACHVVRLIGGVLFSDCPLYIMEVLFTVVGLSKCYHTTSAALIFNIVIIIHLNTCK